MYARVEQICIIHESLQLPIKSIEFPKQEVALKGKQTTKKKLYAMATWKIIETTRRQCVSLNFPTKNTLQTVEQYPLILPNKSFYKFPGDCSCLLKKGLQSHGVITHDTLL